jgi:hypothetical protein
MKRREFIALTGATRRIFRIDEGRVVEEQRLGLGPGSRSTENG